MGLIEREKKVFRQGSSAMTSSADRHCQAGHQPWPGVVIRALLCCPELI